MKYAFFKKAFVPLCGATLLSGCIGEITNPVVFGQATTVGISLGQSANTQSPAFVLGYKDVNIAFLPTALTTKDGDQVPIGSKSPSEDGVFEGTFSVFGQFEVNAANGAPGSDGQQPGLQVGLGKFFATGDAAKKLAAGFACKLSEGKVRTDCTEPATAN